MTVMKIYHEMYNLDYLDDIVKGKRKPSDILKNQNETVFIEVESSVNLDQFGSFPHREI